MGMRDIWLFLHVLAAIVAFGALFAQPMILRSADGAAEAFAKVGMYIQAPALVIVIATGIGSMYTIGYSFADPWVSIAFTVWILMAVVLFLMVRAYRSGSKSIAGLTGGMHLLLVIALWSMIWQPGLGTGG